MHALIKTWLVNSKLLPDWFSQKILDTWKIRDNSKELKKLGILQKAQQQN